MASVFLRTLRLVATAILESTRPVEPYEKWISSSQVVWRYLDVGNLHQMTVKWFPIQIGPNGAKVWVLGAGEPLKVNLKATICEKTWNVVWAVKCAKRTRMATWIGWMRKRQKRSKITKRWPFSTTPLADINRSQPNLVCWQIFLERVFQADGWRTHFPL